MPKGVKEPGWKSSEDWGRRAECSPLWHKTVTLAPSAKNYLRIKLILGFVHPHNVNQGGGRNGSKHVWCTIAFLVICEPESNCLEHLSIPNHFARSWLFIFLSIAFFNFKNKNRILNFVGLNLQKLGLSCLHNLSD